MTAFQCNQSWPVGLSVHQSVHIQMLGESCKGVEPNAGTEGAQPPVELVAGSRGDVAACLSSCSSVPWLLPRSDSQGLAMATIAQQVASADSTQPSGLRRSWPLPGPLDWQGLGERKDVV